MDRADTLEQQNKEANNRAEKVKPAPSYHPLSAPPSPHHSTPCSPSCHPTFIHLLHSFHLHLHSCHLNPSDSQCHFYWTRITFLHSSPPPPSMLTIRTALISLPTSHVTSPSSSLIPSLLLSSCHHSSSRYLLPSCHVPPSSHLYVSLLDLYCVVFV